MPNAQMLFGLMLDKLGGELDKGSGHLGMAEL